MRYVMTSVVANFRPTLAFFSKRDAAMSALHPKEFPHWMRGENYFNLVDQKTRRAIRFEASRFVVRVEGQNSLEPFHKCLEMALSMLEDFEIVDIFAGRLESIQAKAEKGVRGARMDFAKTFMHPTLVRVFPHDERTDYAVVAERTEQVDDKLIPAGARLNNRALTMRSSITLGPASREEIAEKWLEFKERSPNILYRTKPALPRAAQLFAMQMTIQPRAKLIFFKLKTLTDFYELALERSTTTYDAILGRQ